MYYTVIKQSGHLRTLEKCRKHSPAARVFYISLVFSNARRVLSQCNTRLRLLYLLNIQKFGDRSTFLEAHTSNNLLKENQFRVLRKCHGKLIFDCFVSEMLLIRSLMPSLNTQTDSTRDKLVVFHLWCVCVRLCVCV